MTTKPPDQPQAGPKRASRQAGDNNLARVLRLDRTVRGVGLRAAAAEIGTSSATLMRIEHGQAFDAETLIKLWQWLLRKAKR